MGNKQKKKRDGEAIGSKQKEKDGEAMGSKHKEKKDGEATGRMQKEKKERKDGEAMSSKQKEKKDGEATGRMQEETKERKDGEAMGSKRKEKKEKKDGEAMGSKQKEEKDGEAMGSKQKEKEGEEHEQQDGHNKNKKRKEFYPYGNYRFYYGYRIQEEEPRLKVFKKEWFQGKDCLDIGCNNGTMTIQIAEKFCCQSILGIDIDAGLIQEAYWNIRKFMRMEIGRNIPGKESKKVSKKMKGEDSKIDGQNVSECSIEGSLTEELKEIPTNCHSEDKNLLDIVSFQQEDFVNCRYPPKKHYDTIICLSVTKWIHLNWGDEGLITLFSRIWRLLHPGGILVLEPQDWKSYEKNKRTSETIRTNFKDIMFCPRQFQDLLLDKIGFRTVEVINSGVSGKKGGFNRPILVFQK